MQVDAGPLKLLGYGQLGAYAIRSNTFASKLVHHVLGDKQGATPPEGATGTVLESLRYNAVVAQLLALGPAPAPLSVIAKFMGQVAQVFAHLLRQNIVSKCLCETTAVALQNLGHCWRIELESSVQHISNSGRNNRHYVYAEHVILACGASQEPPQLDQRHHQTKVVCSNEALSSIGLNNLRTKFGSNPGKVCVVGGAHSAFSVAWLCIHGENTQYSPRINLSSTSVASTLTPPTKSATTTRSEPASPCRNLVAGAANNIGAAFTATATPNQGQTSLFSQTLPSISTCRRSFTVSTHCSSSTLHCVQAETNTRTVLRAAFILDVDTAALSVVPRASLPPLEATAVIHTTTFSSLVLTTAASRLSITILHRSPVRVFYTSKREADSDSYKDFKQTNRHGQVHAFAGLRGDAKNFFNDIVRGREPRVRLCQVKRGGSKSLIARCFDEAHVIVWATGYKSQTIPILDKHDSNIRLRTSQGQVQVDKQGRVLRIVPTLCEMSDIVPNLYGNGHGYGLPAVYDNGELDGSKGRADGIAVYMKQGAAVILYTILGEAYPGPPPHIQPPPDKPPPPKMLVSPEKQLAHIDRLCQPRPPPSNHIIQSALLSSPAHKMNRGSKRQKHNRKVSHRILPTQDNNNRFCSSSFGNDSQR